MKIYSVSYRIFLRSVNKQYFHFSTECAQDEFICDNDKCVSTAKKCDRVRDCEDGTDEINCTQPGKFNPHFIIFRSILTTLQVIWSYYHTFMRFEDFFVSTRYLYRCLKRMVEKVEGTNFTRSPYYPLLNLFHNLKIHLNRRPVSCAFPLLRIY